MKTSLHMCKWCKTAILSPLEVRTVKKNGKMEYFHYHHNKDCFSDMLRAMATARKLLQNEDTEGGIILGEE